MSYFSNIFWTVSIHAHWRIIDEEQISTDQYQLLLSKSNYFLADLRMSYILFKLTVTAYRVRFIELAVCAYISLHLPGQVSSLISFSGDLFNNATDSTMDFVKMSQSTRKTGLFTLLAFKESSRLEFLSCFMGFLTMTRSLVCMLLSTNTILTTR